MNQKWVNILWNHCLYPFLGLSFILALSCFCFYIATSREAGWRWQMLTVCNQGLVLGSGLLHVMGWLVGWLPLVSLRNIFVVKVYTNRREHTWSHTFPSCQRQRDTQRRAHTHLVWSRVVTLYVWVTDVGWLHRQVVCSALGIDLQTCQAACALSEKSPAVLL